MQKTKISRKDIDVLIYATYSFEKPSYYLYQEVGYFMDELGLENAYPIGTFLSGCGNIHTAIRVGINLIKSQECQNIVIVTTDISPDNFSRIVPPNISVLSDAAASFILTTHKTEGEFKVLSNSQYMNTKMKYIDPQKQPSEFIEKIMEGIQKTCDKSFKHIKKESKDFDQLIVNNYNISVTRSICATLNFSADKSYSKNISRFAHAGSADNVINLHDLLANNYFTTNELVLLLGTGPSSWGCTVLSKV